MSWDLRDSQRQRPGAGTSSAMTGPVARRGMTGMEGEPLAPDHDAPLGGTMFSWGADDDEDEGGVPLEAQRELREQGWLTEREWQAQAKIMRRGVVEI